MKTVRNFWVEVEINGKQVCARGPKNKTHSMSIRLYMRNTGESTLVQETTCIPGLSNDLTAEQNSLGHPNNIITYTTTR